MPFGLLKPCLRLRKRTKRIKGKHIIRTFNDTVTPIKEDELVQNDHCNSDISAIREVHRESNGSMSSNETLVENEPSFIIEEVNERAFDSVYDRETNSPETLEAILLKNSNKIHNSHISQDENIEETLRKEPLKPILRNAAMHIPGDFSTDTPENLSEIEIDDLPDNDEEINVILEQRNEIINNVTACSDVFEKMEDIKNLELAAKHEYSKKKKKQLQQKDDKIHNTNVNDDEAHCLTDSKNSPNCLNRTENIIKTDVCQGDMYKCIEVTGEDSQKNCVVSEQSFVESYSKLKQNYAEVDFQKETNKRIKIYDECFDEMHSENAIISNVSTKNSLLHEYHSNSKKSYECEDTASDDYEISDISPTITHNTELPSTKNSRSLEFDIEKAVYFHRSHSESPSEVSTCMHIDCNKFTDTELTRVYSDNYHPKHDGEPFDLSDTNIDKNLDIKVISETASAVNDEKIFHCSTFTLDDECISDDSTNEFEEQITSNSNTDRKCLTNIELINSLANEDECNKGYSEKDILQRKSEIFSNKNVNSVCSYEKGQSDNDRKCYRHETDTFSDHNAEENIKAKEIYFDIQSLKTLGSDESPFLNMHQRIVEDDETLISETSNCDSELSNEKKSLTHLHGNETCAEKICESNYSNDDFSHMNEEIDNAENYMSDWSGESKNFDKHMNKTTGEFNGYVSENESEKTFKINKHIAKSVSHDTFIYDSDGRNQNFQKAMEDMSFLKGQCNNRKRFKSPHVFQQRHPVNQVTKCKSQESLQQNILDKDYLEEYLSQFDPFDKTPYEISLDAHNLSCLLDSGAEGDCINNDGVRSTDIRNVDVKRWSDCVLSNSLSSHSYEHSQTEKEIGLDEISEICDFKVNDAEAHKFQKGEVIEPFRNKDVPMAKKNLKEMVAEKEKYSPNNESKSHLPSCHLSGKSNFSKASYGRKNKLLKKEGFDEFEIMRLEYIQLFEKRKLYALSVMGPHLKIIPIKKMKSNNIHLTSIKTGFESENNRSLRKRIDKIHEKLLDLLHRNEFQEHTRNMRPEILSKFEEQICKKKTPESPTNINDSLRNTYYDISESITPERKRILEASRSIRSPKYFRRMNRPTQKEIHHLKRPVLMRPNKVNLVAYVTKDEKNLYQINKGYRISRVSPRKTRKITSEKNGARAPDINKHQNTFTCRDTSPADLRTKFDDVFRKYASKGRTNGELISHKKSTEWLRDAGVIGNTLSAEEAVDAFKLIAGVKIALNKGDYRKFLKKLSRLKRLNYNEVYERLCTADDRYFAK